MHIQERHINLISLLIVLIGVSSMVFGVFRGETPVMFEKAINICLECIGIG
ncbi:CD1871A family CXXC motif-containing protein [Aminipila terrae]|uniref:Thioredoxin n=1 Tax=Aminipila terrae TaxID=2697030 RepID=A0A6P1MJ15_9FIRM|nr:CD1871A family CXXC motif-containing protein [Aminipila terrae]QHI73721.1 thioredoxin [Aminipila terrae]